LAHGGRKVGLLDADLNSPSILAMLGMRPARRMPAADRIEPAAGPLGLRVAGVDLLNEREPLPPSFLLGGEPESLTEPGSSPKLNGRYRVSLDYSGALARMLGRLRLDALDVVIIDLAPGLEALARLAQFVPRAHLLAVSHPSAAAAEHLSALLEFGRESGLQLRGVIENMAGFSCDSCHTVRPLLPQGKIAATARALGVPLLERLPFDPRLAESCDRGTIFVREYPEAPLARQLITLAEVIGAASDLSTLESSSLAAPELEGK
jgi:ATP-binding protein involved in chromosome partitioning